MLIFGPLDLLAAWALDAILGDPLWIPWPHPVVLIGRVVGRLDRGWNRDTDPEPTRRRRGAMAWLLVVGGTLALAGAVWRLAWALHPLAGRAVGVYLAYAALATRCLADEARGVAEVLGRDDVAGARRRVGRIVGRDTAALEPNEIARATVETVAENASDGVVAPLFHLVVGVALGVGPALAWAYKAANTLDSMVGYHSPHHAAFGRFSARADDLLNWVPARVTAGLAMVGAEVLWRAGRRALATVYRDAPLHGSPNAGWPEAAWAGAVEAGLGGAGSCGGQPRVTPHLGPFGAPVDGTRVVAARHLLWVVSGLAAVLAATCLAIMSP